MNDEIIPNVDEFGQMKCPLCSKPLANDEYDKAIKELKNKIQESYEKQDQKRASEFEEQLKQLKENHENDLKFHQATHHEQLKALQEDLEKSYQKQMEMIHKQYEDFAKQSQLQSLEIQKQLKETHERELAEKSSQISELKKEQERFKKEALKNAETVFEHKAQELKAEINERDIQIDRFSKQVESLEKQLSQSQSELKGEIGELDLYATLTHAFPNDFFRQQKRGTSSGDLVQQIRTSTGAIDIPIVYDNKNANTVTKNDIEKAKKYRRIHGTNYVIIVANNIPKKSIPNGLYGEIDGILVVHPSIIVEVTKQIRSGIIEISKFSKSKEDQKAKQAKLYEYIISHEFSTVLESLTKINEKFYGLQAKEEKDHETLWKNRKSLQEQLLKTYTELSSGIESITQEDAVASKKAISPIKIRKGTESK